MECIVFFDVVYENVVKELRGLIFLGKGQAPSEEDFLQMFEDMGYKLRLDNKEQWIFKPLDASASYQGIRIRKLDMGDDEYKEDMQLRSIVGNLLPKESRPL